MRIDHVQKILLLHDRKPVPVKQRSVWGFMKHELHDVTDGKQCWAAINHSEQLECIHSLDRNYLLKLKVIYIYMHAPFFWIHAYVIVPCASF